MQNPIDLEIRRRIDQFLTELDTLVRKAAVESVQQALSGGSGNAAASVAPRTAGKVKPSAGRAAEKASAKSAGKKGKSGRRARRSSELVAKLGDLVQAYVAAHPGARLEHISTGVEVESHELKRPLRTLVASGSLRSEGRRRGTRYFAGNGKSRAKA